MDGPQIAQLFIALGLVATGSWLLYEVWLRLAPVEEFAVQELKLNTGNEGDRWYRARITVLSGFAPDDRWVWISRKKYETLDAIPGVLSVHVRSALGRTRMRAHGHWRRVWWIGAAVAFFLINFVNSFTTAYFE